MTKKKSEFYHLRWNKIGINAKKTAEVLGVAIEQVSVWDDEDAPTSIKRCLMYWDKKHVGYNGWNEFYFSRGKLRYKKLMWSADALLRNHDYLQDTLKLKRQIAELETWHGLATLFFKISIRSCKRFIERVKRF